MRSPSPAQAARAVRLCTPGFPRRSSPVHALRGDNARHKGECHRPRRTRRRTRSETWKQNGKAPADCRRVTPPGWEAREGQRARTRPRSLARPAGATARSQQVPGQGARRARRDRHVHQRGARRARDVAVVTRRPRRRAHRHRPRDGDVRHVPAAGHAAADREDPGGRTGHRPGPPRQAAPQLGPAIIGLISVHVVAVVLGYAAQVVRRPVARTHPPGHDVPGHAARRRRPRPAVPGRVHLLPVRASQDEVRDLVGRPPLHLPGSRALDPASGPDRRALHGSPAGHGLVADASGSRPPAPSSSTAGACRSRAASSTR